MYIIKASIEGMYYKYNVYYTLHFNACLLQMHLLLNILACIVLENVLSIWKLIAWEIVSPPTSGGRKY